MNSYNIHVGKNLIRNPVFIPFDHWQNDLFIISAETVGSSNVLTWLSIDQPSKSIIFDISQIKSVGNYNISISAKMITYFINTTDTSKYTTNDYFVSFTFSNDNCVFVSSNASYYLVVNRLTIFMLTFADTEEDFIYVTILQNSFVNTFVQGTSNTNQFEVMLQTNESSTILWKNWHMEKFNPVKNDINHYETFFFLFT